MNSITTSPSNEDLSLHARSIRRSILTMLTEAGSGHTAGALGMVEVFVSLYFKLAEQKADNPSWPERDYVLLSAGHICPVLYATLAERGYFPLSELATLRDINSRLQGHPHLHSLPGIEISSGPLGQGLSQAIGLAMAFQLDKKTNHVFCILSDGEQQEGQTWEAYMYAGSHSLSNITVFIDRNNIQIGGTTDQVLPINPLDEKIRAFGWNTITIDGHSYSAIENAVSDAQESDQPTAIICNTTAGKGVSFIENDYTWHGKPPTESELQRALEELS